MILDIPELSLVVLVGASSSGKSTFARQHFSPTEIISSDQCRAFISDDPADQSATDDAFDLLHHWVGLRLKRGRLTVVDATNVQPFARKSLIELARQHHVLPVAIVLDLPERVLLERHRARTDRDFSPHVLTNHRRDLHRSVGGLEKEGFRYVHVLKSELDIAAVQINRTRTWNDRRTDTGPFDIIGDVHGCYPELLELLDKLGYTRPGEGETLSVVPPAGRKAVFVGDLTDRGPDSPAVLQLVMNMVRDGVALCVPGNHDDKLHRYLSGKKVSLTHGLDQTIAQLDARPPAFQQQVRQFLGKLVSHYVLDGGRLVVAHAGLPEAMQGRASGAVRAFCLYGETTGETDEYGLPVRLNWAANYRGRAMVVHGHVPVPAVEWLNNVIDIDTGCCFGGQLTALRYPEKELVSVPAHRVYSEPKRPLVAVSELPIAQPDLQTSLPSVAETAGQNNRDGFQPAPNLQNESLADKTIVPLTAQQEADGVLDLADVLGRRTVLTRVGPPVKIPEESAIAALEVMSRFAIAPQWLLYLPPTMSPVETSALPDYLEHPAEAFAYYRKQGVERMVCEEKHMGSRVVVIVCRQPAVAQTRFGLSAPADGVVYTRTGRAFFADPTVETALLHRLQTALTHAKFWGRFETDWIALDAELMPWSAKARELIRSQYAAVGAAGTATLSATVDMLAQAAGRGLPVQTLQVSNAGQTDRMGRFREAYGQYCRAVDGIEGLTLAPFHLLATEGRVHTDQPHDWHLAQIADLCAADPALLTMTDHRFVDLTDPSSIADATDWWEGLTRAGGEGMVVKPLAFVPRTAKGSGPATRLIQPAVKCRGREYLRIIYGPDYDTPDHLAILKKRGLQVKRSLALQEFALGLESLGRFVAREPLRRVHECTFGVLALESEDVDPTL